MNLIPSDLPSILLFGLCGGLALTCALYGFLLIVMGAMVDFLRPQDRSWLLRGIMLWILGSPEVFYILRNEVAFERDIAAYPYWFFSAAFVGICVGTYLTSLFLSQLIRQRLH